MTKVPAYARFLNLMNNLKKSNPDPQFDGCDDILAYIASRESESLPVCITDLVLFQLFGTGPTVCRKVNLLAERGLIEVLKNPSDARAKSLLMTSKGRNFLKEKTQIFKQCFEN